jgi:hypothetical protein
MSIEIPDCRSEIHNLNQQSAVFEIANQQSAITNSLRPRVHSEMPAQLGQRVAVASFGRDVHGVDDRFPCEGLSQQRDDAKIEGAANVLRITETGHEDHLRRERAAKGRADGKTVWWRHDQIQENDVGIVDRRRVERLAARRCRDDCVPFFLEPDGDQASQFI